MFYVYILYSSKYDRFYIGQTADISQRLQQHNNKYEHATSPYVPWELVLKLEKPNRSEAIILEKKLKNLNRVRLVAFIEKYKYNSGG